MGKPRLVTIPTLTYRLTRKCFYGTTLLEATTNMLKWLAEVKDEVRIDHVEAHDRSTYDEERSETIEHWTYTVYVEGDPDWPETAAQIENERNALLRRIAQLEQTLGIPPWWQEEDEQK